MHQEDNYRTPTPPTAENMYRGIDMYVMLLTVSSHTATHLWGAADQAIFAVPVVLPGGPWGGLPEVAGCLFQQGVMGIPSQQRMSNWIVTEHTVWTRFLFIAHQIHCCPYGCMSQMYHDMVHPHLMFTSKATSSIALAC